MKYRWLKDYTELQNIIEVLELSLERYNRELGRWTIGDLSNIKLDPESKASKLEEIIYDVKWQLAETMNDQHNLKKLVSSFKGLEHKILYMKYIEGKTLEEIAEELDYSAQYIYNKHADIKKQINLVEQLT